MAQETLERIGLDEGSKERTIDELYDELEMLKVTDIVVYQKTIGEIAQWGAGATNAKRMTLHPTKTDEDFSRLLERLGEDLLSGMPVQESGL